VTPSGDPAPGLQPTPLLDAGPGGAVSSGLSCLEVANTYVSVPPAASGNGVDLGPSVGWPV